MPPTIIRADPSQAAVVSSVLTEAADWVASRGKRLWHPVHVSLEAVAPDVDAGMYYIAWLNGEAAGVVRLQTEDLDFWPDAAAGDAVYLHRLAVRRRYAGGDVSSALLNWIVAHARELGRKYVRLDCAADRPALRRVYEVFGFRFHDERNMGSFVVARYQFELVPAG
jgi:GNAT superfamily N-acetyltransferase